MSLGYVPLALMFTLGGVLRGAGDTLSTMLLTFLSLWVVRVPVAAYLSSLPQLGVAGVWIALALSPYMGFVLHYVVFRFGRWREKAVVKNQLQSNQG